MVKLTSKDWVRMLIAFLLGVAITLLVIQLTGGQLFKGSLTESFDVTSTDTETELSLSMQRLSTGVRVVKDVDDAEGMAIEEDVREEDPERYVEEDPITNISVTEEDERSTDTLDDGIRE